MLEISRKIWRYRIVTLPVLALTLLGAIYVVAFKKSEYVAASSYVLINPPAPPTAEEIAANPALGRISPENPYTRFTDQSVVVDLLASSLSNESARRALAQQGADPGYTVERSSGFGYTSLVLEITGMGPTPATAIESAKLVGVALTSELERLQASQGVAARYQIETERVVAPDHAEQRVSGRLRPLVGVFALGGILLFVVVSAAEAMTTLRAERSKQGVPKDKQAVPKDKRRSGEGAGTNISRAGKWLRGLRGAGHAKEVTGEKDNNGSFEDAGTNNSPAHERQPRPPRAGSKEAVSKDKDKEQTFEDAGTNNSPAHQRQPRPPRAGSKA